MPDPDTFAWLWIAFAFAACLVAGAPFVAMALHDMATARRARAQRRRSSAALACGLARAGMVEPRPTSGPMAHCSPMCLRYFRGPVPWRHYDGSVGTSDSVFDREGALRFDHGCPYKTEPTQDDT